LSTRIGKPLSSLRRILSAGSRRVLGGLWPALFAVSLLSSSLGVAIWLFDYVPGSSDASQKLHMTWALLLVGLAALLVAIVAALVRELD
jgi:hypothetical protein